MTSRKTNKPISSYFAQELNTYYSAMSARFAIVKLRLIRWDFSRVNVTPMSSSSTDTFVSEADAIAEIAKRAETDRDTYLAVFDRHSGVLILPYYAEDDWRRKELNFDVSFDYFIYDVGGGVRLFQDYKSIRRAKYRF